MRRSFSPGDGASINSAPSQILFIAGMAAAITMITSLCGVRFRRRSEPEGSKSPSPEGEHAESLDLSALEKNNAKENEESQFKELPLPPGKQFGDPSSAWENGAASGIKKSASTRHLNLTKAISTRIPRSLSLVAGGEKKTVAKREDSLWKKTIILGEKCRLPDVDGHEDAVYDDKGRKIPAYHPKTTSFRDLGTIPPPPSHDKDKKMVGKEEEGLS